MKFHTIVSAALLAAGVATAHADVVLDDFNQPNPGVQTVSSGFGVNGSTSTNTFGLAPGILGGYRTLDATCVSGCSGFTTRSTSLTVEGGELAWSSSTNVRSNVGVTWDANGAGLGANLPALGSTIVASVLEADLGFNYVLTMWTDASNYTSLSSGSVNPVIDGSPQTASYSVSWWDLADGFYFLDGLPFTIANTGAGVNLANVNKIEFRMNNVGTCVVTGIDCSTAVDLRLDNVDFVPEPGSLALVGLALLGAGAASRRRVSRA